MLGHLVASNAEVEHLVAGTEKLLEQIREPFAPLDALAPRERVADDDNAISGGRLWWNVPLAKPEAVRRPCRPAAAPRDVVSGIHARARPSKLKSCKVFGRHERDDGHHDHENKPERER